MKSLAALPGLEQARRTRVLQSTVTSLALSLKCDAKSSYSTQTRYSILECSIRVRFSYSRVSFQSHRVACPDRPNHVLRSSLINCFFICGNWGFQCGNIKFNVSVFADLVANVLFVFKYAQMMLKNSSINWSLSQVSQLLFIAQQCGHF